jgi:hypothetical protein
MTLVAWSALAVIGATPGLFATQDQSERFLLACSVFSANTSEATLRERFGLENVTRGSVTDPNGAEGDRTEGTILFANDADASLEIAWKDTVGRRQPALIRRLATQGRWRTSSGITLGTDLKTVEKLNGRPFRLAGLAFDAQGTVVSWGGGRLDAQNSAECHVGMRLRVESPGHGAAAASFELQVRGDRVFSSGHPAMQALNPTVYELFLWYGRRPANLGVEPTAQIAPASANVRRTRLE